MTRNRALSLIVWAASVVAVTLLFLWQVDARACSPTTADCAGMKRRLVTQVIAVGVAVYGFVVWRLVRDWRR